MDSSVAHVVNSDDDSIPQNYREAVSCPPKDKWIAAVRVELNHMDENSVWIPHELPPGKKPLDSRWISSKEKGMNDETINKARLVIRGMEKITSRSLPQRADSR